MKKIISLLFIIFILNFTFALGADDVPRGSVTLRWGYVQSSVGGYAIYMWDGYQYREVDRVSQDILQWDSDEARIYPDEETIAMYEPNSVTQNLFTAKGKGNKLRNNPNGLYRVMANGAEHDEAEYKDHYFFKIGTINEYGEVALSEPISTKLDNWAEAANEAPEATIIINEGESKTTDRNVDLTINASDDTTKNDDLEVRFSNDNKNNFGEWEKFSENKKWELSEGYGEKIVFVEIKDKEGESTIVSDKIILEELKIEKIEFEILTENGAHATKAENVTLEIKGIDNLSDYECTYKIDDTEKKIEINEDNKIVLPLEKINKNTFVIKLESKDASKIGETEIVIWKLA